MIDNYAEFKHRCIVIPFEEFETIMDCLYDIKDYPDFKIKVNDTTYVIKKK